MSLTMAVTSDPAGCPLAVILAARCRAPYRESVALQSPNASSPSRNSNCSVTGGSCGDTGPVTHLWHTCGTRVTPVRVALGVEGPWGTQVAGGDLGEGYLRGVQEEPR